MRYSQQLRAIYKSDRQRFEYKVQNDRDKRSFCLQNNVEQFHKNHIEFVGKNSQSYHIDWDGNLDWKKFLDSQDSRFVKMMKIRRQNRTKNISKEQMQWIALINTFKAAAKQTSWTAANNRYQAALQQLDILLG